MRRSLIYIIVLGAAMLLPVQGTDVGKLRPVELVFLHRQGDWIVIETDTKDSGRGNTVEEAFQNLEDTTSGIVYLDTADYLLVSENAEELIGELESYLKPSVRICSAERGIELAEAAAYLAVHRPDGTLAESDQGAELEILRIQNGRLILFEKVKNSA